MQISKGYCSWVLLGRSPHSFTDPYISESIFAFCQQNIPHIDWFLSWLEEEIKHLHEIWSLLRRGQNCTSSKIWTLGLQSRNDGGQKRNTIGLFEVSEQERVFILKVWLQVNFSNLMYCIFIATFPYNMLFHQPLGFVSTLT